MIRRGEVFYDISNGVFVGSGANNDEVGTDVFDLVGNEIFNTTSEGKNENNTGDTNGNAETGKKGTGAILTERGFGELVVSDK